MYKAPQNDRLNLSFVKDLHIVGEKMTRNGPKQQNLGRFQIKEVFTCPQESRREGWTDARSAVGFCLGSGLFGSYNSD